MERGEYAPAVESRGTRPGIQGKARSSKVKPFDDYPGAGRHLLGPPRDWTNCRWGYGLELMQRTRQTCCAYCGVSLVDDYYRWLLLSVDHVVPRSQAETVGIIQYLHDMTNLVVCCAGCNGFGNRYTVPQTLLESLPEPDLERFFALRDRVFEARSAAIRQRREAEMQEFQRKRWQHEIP